MLVGVAWSAPGRRPGARGHHLVGRLAAGGPAGDEHETDDSDAKHTATVSAGRREAFGARTQPSIAGAAGEGNHSPNTRMQPRGIE
jgi:hypothetical protein